jgi:itaconyl-CoA hydratase
MFGDNAVTDFPSHVEIGPREYIETIGIEFDVMHEGLIIEHRPGFTFTWRDSLERTRISGDHTPSLVDPDIAEKCGGGTAEILQTWILGSLASMTTRAFGRVTANLGWENAVFETPTHDGDTMFAESKVLDKRESKSRPHQGILHISTRGVTRTGAEICRFERRLLVYRGAQEPHKKAGYV